MQQINNLLLTSTCFVEIYNLEFQKLTRLQLCSRWCSSSGFTAQNTFILPTFSHSGAECRKTSATCCTWSRYYHLALKRYQKPFAIKFGTLILTISSISKEAAIICVWILFLVSIQKLVTKNAIMSVLLPTSTIPRQIFIFVFTFLLSIHKMVT